MKDKGLEAAFQLSGAEAKFEDAEKAMAWWQDNKKKARWDDYVGPKFREAAAKPPEEKPEEKPEAKPEEQPEEKPEEKASGPPPMSESERAEAMGFLLRSDLLDQVARDIDALGYVGERALMLLLVLVPLSGLALVASGSDDWLPLHVGAHVAFFTALAVHLSTNLRPAILRRMLPGAATPPRRPAAARCRSSCAGPCLPADRACATAGRRRSRA